MLSRTINDIFHYALSKSDFSITTKACFIEWKILRSSIFKTFSFSKDKKKFKIFLCKMVTPLIDTYQKFLAVVDSEKYRVMILHESGLEFSN